MASESIRTTTIVNHIRLRRPKNKITQPIILESDMSNPSSFSRSKSTTKKKCNTFRGFSCIATVAVIHMFGADQGLGCRVTPVLGLWIMLWREGEKVNQRERDRARERERDWPEKWYKIIPWLMDKKIIRDSKLSSPKNTKHKIGLSDPIDSPVPWFDRVLNRALRYRLEVGLN